MGKQTQQPVAIPKKLALSLPDLISLAYIAGLLAKAPITVSPISFFITKALVSAATIVLNLKMPTLVPIGNKMSMEISYGIGTNAAVSLIAALSMFAATAWTY